ncbi:MAG: ComEC/Rec2 family competence protein [Candidatus Saccharimonadales bacterium]
MRWLRQRIHVSWLIALASLAFVLGVLLALFVMVAHWIFIISALIGVGVSFWRQRLYIIPLICVSFGMIGLVYGSITRGDLSIYQHFVGVELSLRGRIKEDPSLNAKRELILQLDSIALSGHSLPGTIWVSALGHPDVKRGDEVVVKGELGAGFGTYAALMYRGNIITITRPSPGNIGRVVRDWFADAVRRTIPEPQASLGIGYLTGQKSALPSELSQALQIAGLTHVVVASGYNLTILVRLARRLFVRISKFLSALSSSIMIVCFIAVTGLSPSMTRAGLVSGLSLASWYYGRQFHPFVLLPFAAAITVAWQPSYAWGDIGWELSFSAFAAVMIVGPLMQRFFFGEKDPGTLRQILGETVAAHIVTMPIIVIGFGMISNIAIIANIMIVPLVPIAMLLTFISGVVELSVPSIAEMISLPATWLLTYMTTTAQWLADLPWSQTKIQIEWWGAGIYYTLLVVACIIMWRITKFSLRSTNIVK